MALLQANFMARSLMRTVPVHIILPVDKPAFPGTVPKEVTSYKTLYLLHGIFGNYMDWVSGTNIQRWAEEKDLAVVMTRKAFPLSHRREDTFIAGLSMGGYGAIRNGLKYHDTFGYIAGLSAAMPVEGLEERTNDTTVDINRRDFAESIFGDLSKVKASDMNPKWLVERLKEQGAELPKMYLACGTEDSLLEPGREMRDYLRQAGMDVTYEEGPGGHEWDFWNRYIKKVIDWLPLNEDVEPGINSGNVGI